MKKIFLLIIVLILIAVMMLLASCSNNEITAQTHPIYGIELYNARFAISPHPDFPEDEFRHVIPFMSSIDLSNASIAINSSGATYNFRYEIEYLEYTLNSHVFHSAILLFTNVVFYDDIFSIFNVTISLENGEEYFFEPYRAEFIQPSHEILSDFLFFTGVPLGIPQGMDFFPISLTADATIRITNVIMTNPSFDFEIYYIIGGQTEELQFEHLDLIAGESVELFLPFAIDDSGLGLFMHYGTSILVEYIYNNETFVVRNPGIATYFNPFNPLNSPGSGSEAVARYFNEVIRPQSEAMR